MSWMRCTRCAAELASEPLLMAGRMFCCESCAVGSACSHQGVERDTEVRRFDTNFDRFRDSARRSSPYERTRLPDGD